MNEGIKHEVLKKTKEAWGHNGMNMGRRERRKRRINEPN
jgi:hypothetical protein